MLGSASRRHCAVLLMPMYASDATQKRDERRQHYWMGQNWLEQIWSGQNRRSVNHVC